MNCEVLGHFSGFSIRNRGWYCEGRREKGNNLLLPRVFFFSSFQINMFLEHWHLIKTALMMYCPLLVTQTLIISVGDSGLLELSFPKKSHLYFSGSIATYRYLFIYAHCSKLLLSLRISAILSLLIVMCFISKYY